MDTLRHFHSGMVHAIADLALFFYGYMRRVLTIVIGRKMYVFNGYAGVHIPYTALLQSRAIVPRRR
jgi:hypothetical protein